VAGRKVIVQEFVTLDGFAAGPSGELDFVTEGNPDADPTSGSFVEDQLAFIGTLDTILLGAVTYRMFAAYWPEQTAETQLIADALNATPKVVFSSTLEEAPWGEWEPARLVSGSAADEVRRLKDEPGKDMVVWGSLKLAQSLAREGLVDEYHLFVRPLALGEGQRLFDRAAPAMRVVGTKDYGGGVVSVWLQPAGGDGNSGSSSSR
jgi:dihydrofolate reductase